MFTFHPFSVFAYKHKENPVEMLRWEEVKELIAKYSKFIVHDLETGMEFKVAKKTG